MPEERRGYAIVMKAKTPTPPANQSKRQPKHLKEALVEEAIRVFGGRKSYYQNIRKEYLEAALHADKPTRQFAIAIVAQIGKSAQTNQKVNGRRLVAENKANVFAGAYKEELQRRTHLEVQYEKILRMLKQLLDVDSSELLWASRKAVQILNQMLPQKPL